MDLVKQYIVQCIIQSSNNLRLNTEKIEVVSLLRELVVNSKNLENDIAQMKKITEFSKLAIRLNDIYNFLTQGKIDFTKLTDKFKDHSSLLIKDLSSMLDMVNPPTYKKLVERLKNKEEQISIDLSEKTVTIEQNNSEEAKSKRLLAQEENERLKEKIIFDEDKEDEALFFQNYEATILKHIKPIDELLKRLSNNEIDADEIIKFAKVLKNNAELSTKIGFDLIATMHKIFIKSLLLIRSRELMPGKEVISGMRACLIVIVAVVRGKEVEITNYLNRAEELGKKIQMIKIRE